MRTFLYLPILILALLGCEKTVQGKRFSVKNTLDHPRAFETVTLPIDSLGLPISSTLVIKDLESGKIVASQSVDQDGDGQEDVLLFQPKIEAKSVKFYEVIAVDTIVAPKQKVSCYSRFVPERTDDFAWENDRVAFRTFGPTAQKMVEENVPGGTLTSGIDAWLKRVDYPIINKWYEKYTEGTGTYHEDTGEGLDNFHVGKSRGIGGIAIKVDTTYYTSKNFVSWEHRYNGPIRTAFVLTYANWDAAGNSIREEKRVSLDYGSNLTRFEVSLSPADTVSVGLTLHENDGRITIDQQMDWVSYWQPHGDSELGSGVVVPDQKMVGYDHYLTDVKDLSNLFSHIENTDGSVIYYAGFGWKKSGQFESKAAWEAYLDQFADHLKHPLIVVFNE